MDRFKSSSGDSKVQPAWRTSASGKPGMCHCARTATQNSVPRDTKRKWVFTEHHSEAYIKVMNRYEISTVGTQIFQRNCLPRDYKYPSLSSKATP